MKYIKHLIILAIIAAVIITAIGTFYGWWLGQTIFQTTYANKAGVDFWSTWTLENNIFTASILLAILSMITLPQRSTFITFITTLSNPKRAVHRLETGATIIWRLLEFGFFFLFYVTIGGYAVTGQNVAFLMMLMGDGSIAISSAQVGTLFSLPFAPGTPADSIVGLIPAMEAYQLYFGLISTFFAFSAGRIALSLASDFLGRNRDIYILISKGLFVGVFLLIIGILAVPTWTANAGTWLTYVSYILALIGCTIGGFAFLGIRLHSGDTRERLKSKIAQLEDDIVRLQGELHSVREEYESGDLSSETYRQRISLLMEDQTHIGGELKRLKIQRMFPLSNTPRSFGVLATFLIILVVVAPVAQGFFYGIQMDGDKYIEWKFNYETTKEIEITNWAAGISDMEMKTIDDLTTNATPESEVEFLTSVRQWDQEASYLRMKNQIGTNWMQLADSDIVYLNGHEYWIAPLTFDYETVTESFINQHLIYTHTEGLVVLDAYSGDLIEGDNLLVLFNRSQDINMYYGEGSGFYDVVFVDVPSFNEVGNNTFQGDYDYQLSGFESSYYFFTMGPESWSFMGRDMDMLVQRDVLSRVNSILLQGLRADTDPYIVVDPNGELYYAVSVFIDYQLSTNYAHENYMRFMGVVLVDIESGELQFYNSPDVDGTFFIDRTYMEHYDWVETPAWLQSQMKWPEDLYERQLEVAFIYHVNDGFIWKAGTEFHQAPEGSDTRYIISRIDGEDRFVAFHNSEFLDSAGRNLAGLYIMGCGNKEFGKLTFYSAGEQGYSTLLGPNAAVQAFETNDQVRTQLALWGKHRYGNRLMYHLGGSLLFVIPVFLVVETSAHSVIQKLGGIGLVDALTGERVELGANVVEAYYKMFGLLNQTTVIEGEVGFDGAEFHPLSIDSGEFTQLLLQLRNNDNESHNLFVDISIASGNFTVMWHGSEVTPVIYSTNTTYTLDIGSVGVGDVYGTTPLVTAYLPSGIVSVQYLVLLTLRTEAGIVDQISLILTIT